MSLLRDDARRGCAARRARSSSSPARITAPAIATVAVAGLVAALLVGIGEATAVVVAAVVIIALLAAIAARRTTGSLLAGVALLTVRPYQPGERVRLYSVERREMVDAEIVRIGLLNTTLCTDSGLLVVANTRMVRTAPEQTAA